MAYEKASNRVEDIAGVEQNTHHTIPPTNLEIYHGDSEIVVDIGSAAIKSAGTSDLKLAKDGHVCFVWKLVWCNLLTTSRPF
jgi:hypothetical protein